MEKLRGTFQLSGMSLLHFAPERALKSYFRKTFQNYTTADLDRPDVDYQADLLSLPFADQSYDFVYASHVLEHVKNDSKAISEIRRVLRPRGIAVLPVPIVGVKTIEYAEPNVLECGHVRAPGADYFERYARHFSKVEVLNSRDFPEEHQLFNYEDRAKWPTKEMPLRKAMPGERHLDYVPVCFA
jgi:predicted SAM-dependent methyltransferase